METAFFGTQPWSSLLDALLRAAVMFVTLLLLVPQIWRRSFASLTQFEAVLLAAIGGLAGYTVVAPTVPLLHAMAGMALLAVLYRVAEFAGLSRLWHSASAREPRRVAHNGRLDVEALRAASLNRAELFSALRQAGIAHLGEVKAAYIEPSGHISVLRCPEDEIRAGLPMAPQSDGTARGVRLRHAINNGAYACSGCGEVIHLTTGAAFSSCQSCGGHKWVPAQGATVHDSFFSEDSASTPQKVQ